MAPLVIMMWIDTQGVFKTYIRKLKYNVVS